MEANIRRMFYHLFALNDRNFYGAYLGLIVPFPLDAWGRIWLAALLGRIRQARCYPKACASR
jgi:hypothetical protein